MSVRGVEISFVNANGVYNNKKIKHPNIRANNIRGILGLADTRISVEQHRILSLQHNKDSSIGGSKQRFFGTSADTLNPHKSGGCAVFFGRNYLKKCLDVSYDTSNQRRFVNLVAILKNGIKILVSCFYLHANSSERKNKIELIQTLKKDILLMQTKNNPEITVLLCDANITLDHPERDPVCHNEFKSLLNLLQVYDSFSSLHTGKPGFTFFPANPCHKPSRIDYLCISKSCLQKQNKPRLTLIQTFETGSDHLGLKLSASCFAFDKKDMENLKKKTWKFKDHLLFDHAYSSSLKSLMRTFFISISPFSCKNGGVMSYEKLQGIKMGSIGEIFDYDDENFGWTDHFYDLLNLIQTHQTSFSRVRYLESNKKKLKINREISFLKSRSSLSRQQRRLLSVLQTNSRCIFEEDLWNRAFDLNINYEVLGEQATSWLLRRHVAKRGCSYIQELCIDGTLSNDMAEIEDCAKKHFSTTYNTPDCYKSGDLVNFLMDEVQHINCISNKTRKLLENEYSLTEITKTFEKINSQKSGGLDGLTGKLFHFISKMVPKFLASCIKYDILEGRCSDKKVMTKKLILIKKAGSKKNDLKKFRPISLYNILLKCATFTISARLKIALEKHLILPHFFTAYKRRLSSTDLIQNVLCFIENSSKFNGNLCILNTDLTSAFDTLSRGLVFEVMQLANFPPSFIESIKKCQHGAKILIMSTIRSPLAEPVCQTSGFSQGDALSGDLFNLGMLPLILVLNYRTNINKYSFKYDNYNDPYNQGPLRNTTCMSYSDDCVAMLTSENNYASVFQTLEIVKQYSKFSSLKLSLSKTSVCFMKKLPDTDILNSFLEYGLESDNLCTNFTFLGYNFNCEDLYLGINELFLQKTEKIKTIFTAYSQSKSLTISGRKAITNSLCTSQFQYIFQPAFLIKQNSLASAQKLINNFCLVKRVCLIEQSLLPTSAGGLGVPCLFNRYITSKIALLHKAIRQERKYELNQKDVPQVWVLHLQSLLKRMHIGKICYTIQTGIADLLLIIRFLKISGAFSLAEIYSCLINALKISNNDALWFGPGLNAKHVRSKLKWKKAKTGHNVSIHDTPVRGFLDSSNPPSPRPPLSHSPRPPETDQNTATSQHNNKSWKNIPILGSLLYPYLANISNWSKKRIQSAPEPWALTIRNPHMCKLFQYGTVYLGHFVDSNLSLNNRSHVNLYRKKSEMFKSSKKILHCLQIGALQILLELRANGIVPVQLCSQGVKSDPIRDCILAPSKFNSKSVYSHISVSRFGGKAFSGIEKFARRGLSVSQHDIISAMVRCQTAIGSHKSIKCSTEIALCAMRSQYHIAKFEGKRRQPCRICLLPETISHIYRHLLNDCAIAKYIWPIAYAQIMKTVRKRVAITDNLIFFNKLKADELRGLSKSDKRDIFSIMGLYKLSLWQCYYSDRFISRNEILGKLHRNFAILCKCIVFRGCQSRIHTANFSFAQNFSNTNYQNLVIQQRNITRKFVGILRDRRRGFYAPAPTGDDQPWPPPGRAGPGRESVAQHNLVHNIFMDSSQNIFSGNGFGSNQRAYAGIIQMKVSDQDAFNDVVLSDLLPCLAWT